MEGHLGRRNEMVTKPVETAFKACVAGRTGPAPGRSAGRRQVVRSGAIRGVEPCLPMQGELSAVLIPPVPAQDELFAVLNPPEKEPWRAGGGFLLLAVVRSWRREGVSSSAPSDSRQAGWPRMSERSPGHEITEAKGKARQAAGKEYGRSAGRAVCLYRVAGACAFVYHGERFNKTGLEAPFQGC